jgi:hypothetical protein
LRTLIEDIVPHLQPGPYDGDKAVNASRFVATLLAAEAELRAAYERETRA